MDIYTKEIDGRIVVSPRNKIIVHKDGAQYINPPHELLIADGWAEYVAPEIVASDEPDKVADAQVLRDDLASTDYKIIKCMEAYLCGEELPYDIAALHAERNAKRAEINELEG